MELIVGFRFSREGRHEEHCLIGDEDPEVYWGEEVTAVSQVFFWVFIPGSG